MATLIPSSDATALQESIHRTLQRPQYTSTLPLELIHELRDSLTTRLFQNLTTSVPDKEFRELLQYIGADDDDDDDEMMTESDEEDAYEDGSFIDEDDLLDYEALQKVDHLHNEVQNAVRVVSDLRKNVPQRAVILARREMQLCLEDKEATLNIASTHIDENDNDINGGEVDEVSSIDMENMRQSLQKLANVLKCSGGKADDVLSVERIEMLQNTIESTRVALKRQQNGEVMDVLDIAMNSSMANEENKTDGDVIKVEEFWFDTESRTGLGDANNEKDRTIKMIRDPYEVFAKYLTV